MKKKILLVLILSLCFLMPNVKAKVVLKEEVENGTYIIGKYMFTRTDQLEAGYGGVLTTPLIMMASKTTEDELKNQTIYYKSLFGEWKNGLTNETITAPDYFEIENRDLIDILPTPQLECTFDEKTVVCATSFNYTKNDGTTSLVYAYSDYSDSSHDFSQKGDGVVDCDYEFYFLKDANGNHVSGDVPVRYENGRFYSGTNELTLALVDYNDNLDDDYDPNQTYHIVSRFFNYGNSEYSEYSNIVTNIGTADYNYLPENLEILGTVNTDERIDTTEDGNYYNVKFDLKLDYVRGDLDLGSDQKYKFKSYEVYSSEKPKDSLIITDLINNYNELYMKNYRETVAQEKYTKARRFANANFDAYLVAETEFEDLGNYTYESTAYSASIVKNYYGKYIAKIKACNDDETNCFYVTTSVLDLTTTKGNAKYGDVNDDGEVTSADLNSLRNLQLGTKDNYNYVNADINNDGQIDSVDITLLERFLSGMYSDTLPNKQITDYAWYGDVNEDGIVEPIDGLVIMKYLSPTFNIALTEQAFKNADVNNDNKINYVDMAFIMLHLSGWEFAEDIPYFPITDYILYGDVNDDGLLDGNDVIYLSKHLDDSIELTTQQLKNADVNNDGAINETDYDILLKNVIAKDSTQLNIADGSPLS